MEGKKFSFQEKKVRWLTSTGGPIWKGVTVETSRGVTAVTKWENCRGVYTSIRTLTKEVFTDALRRALSENPPPDGRVEVE